MRTVEIVRIFYESIKEKKPELSHKLEFRLRILGNIIKF